MAVAVVDAGPLIAAADPDDGHHRRSLEVFERPDLHFVLGALAVAEAAYLLGLRLGPAGEAAFYRGLASYEIEAPTATDCARIGELVDAYSDFPLGGADASIVALAERLEATILITTDHRHFSVVRPRHCESFELLPA